MNRPRSTLGERNKNPTRLRSSSNPRSLLNRSTSPNEVASPLFTNPSRVIRLLTKDNNGEMTMITLLKRQLSSRHTNDPFAFAGNAVNARPLVKIDRTGLNRFLPNVGQLKHPRSLDPNRVLLTPSCNSILHPH